MIQLGRVLCGVGHIQTTYIQLAGAGSIRTDLSLRIDDVQYLVLVKRMFPFL